MQKFMVLSIGVLPMKKSKTCSFFDGELHRWKVNSAHFWI